MKRIISGRFQTQDNADAVAALLARYINTAEISTDHINPPGRYDAFDVRDDEYDGPRAEDVFGAHHGQVIALAAEGINAYSGPLVGAMAEQGVYDDKPRSQEPRRSGIILSVGITNELDEDRVIAALRAAGATSIVPEFSKWRDGDWANFKSYAAPPAAARPLH